MLTKRVIPCLDVKDGRVVKGVNFVSLRDAGDPVELATAYDREGADEVIFAPVYGARETSGKADSSDLCFEVSKRMPAKYFGFYDEINDYLNGILKKGDTVVFTGAGTINLAGEKLVSLFSQK